MRIPPFIYGAASAALSMVLLAPAVALGATAARQLMGTTVSVLRERADWAHALPDLPSLNEAGVKGYDNSSWSAVAAPAGTPVCLIENVSAIRRGGAVRASNSDEAGVTAP